MVPFDLRGVSILVVEDDPDALELMGMFLRPTGATVRQARDGYEALLLAHQDRPDVVFCDLRMPRLDGHALVDRFKRDERLSAVPVIATTALGDDADVMHTCLAGFAGHLVKPILPEMVDALLQEVLKKPTSSSA
jgi:two-component system, cell cycle response regulator